MVMATEIDCVHYIGRKTTVMTLNFVVRALYYASYGVSDRKAQKSPERDLLAIIRGCTVYMSTSLS